jgi:hypothetical protein
VLVSGIVSSLNDRIDGSLLVFFDHKLTFRTPRQSRQTGIPRLDKLAVVRFRAPLNERDRQLLD